MNDVTVVLAHGALADGSSWAKVIARQDLGRKTLAAPLPLTSFQDDVAALDRTLERAPGSVVLAAYAGAVIGAISSGQVKALVYVAALAPDEGETGHILPRLCRGRSGRTGRPGSWLLSRTA